MMSTKKLFSIGYLDMKLSLVLRESVAKNNNFDINKYNSLNDLENLFLQSSETINNYENNNNNSDSLSAENFNVFDYMDFISLSSDDPFTNTLLYINRTYKTKIFIEYLLLNKIKYTSKNFFMKSVIEKIFSKNYFFFVESSFPIDSNPKVKLIIKVINDNDDEIISSKSFDIFENSNEDEDEENIKIDNIFDTDNMDYNCSNDDYFLINISNFLKINWKNIEEPVKCIENIISQNNNIKIILILTDDFINENFDISICKTIINYSDIIFCFKSSINYFYKLCNEEEKRKKYRKYKNESPISNNKIYSLNIFNSKFSPINKKNKKYDLILYDYPNKIRSDIPTLTIILDNFDYLSICLQEDDNIEPDINENYIFRLMEKDHSIEEYRQLNDFLLLNKNLFYHIFVGGVISRIIGGGGKLTSHEDFFCTGNLILKNSINTIKNNIDYIVNVDDYNIIIPKIRKSVKELLCKKKLVEMQRNLKKEQKFVLDCTNATKSQKKEYNPLLDGYCSSFLRKKNTINLLIKKGFLASNGLILKDPDSVEVKNNLKENKNRNKSQFDRTKLSKTFTNFFNKNNASYTTTIEGKNINQRSDSCLGRQYVHNSQRKGKHSVFFRRILKSGDNNFLPVENNKNEKHFKNLISRNYFNTCNSYTRLTISSDKKYQKYLKGIYAPSKKKKNPFATTYYSQV